jgi:hypothetical protein
MWTNETVFSKGDLLDDELYDTFISRFYEGSYADRYAHVNIMLDRLQAEKESLEKSKKA